MDWAWANYRPWTEKKGAAEEEDRKKSHPKLPPPFSLLCNLLIRFEWEPGSQHLRTGGGASLWGRMWGDATPPLSIAQSRGPSLPSSSTRRGGETRCYKPRPPPAPAASCRQSSGSSASGVPCPSSRVSCPPGPPRPRAMAVSVPKGQGRNTASPFPLRLRGLHGKIPLSAMPLGDVAWGEDGQRGTTTPILGQPPGSRRFSDHG